MNFNFFYQSTYGRGGLPGRPGPPGLDGKKVGIRNWTENKIVFVAVSFYDQTFL